VYKFGEILSSDHGVYDVRTCTADVHHCAGVSLATFARRRHCQELRRSVIGFVSLLFALRRHCCAAGGLHTRFCQACHTCTSTLQHASSRRITDYMSFEEFLRRDACRASSWFLPTPYDRQITCFIQLCLFRERQIYIQCQGSIKNATMLACLILSTPFVRFVVN